MTLKETLLKNSAWLLVGEISDKILSYLLIIILARMLGDVGLGEYSFVFAAVQTTFLLADIGVGDYIIREISKYPERTRELFSNAVSLKFALTSAGFLTTVAFVVLTPKPNYVLISMIFLSTKMVLLNFGSLFEVVFQSRNKMQYLIGGQIIERVASLVLGAYFLLSGKGLIILFAGLFIAYMLKFIYQGFFFVRNIGFIAPSLNLKIVKELIKGGIPLWLTGVFAFIYFRIDIIMLSLMVNDQVVGWYSAAYKLIDALNFIPYIIFVSAFPSMSRLFVENKELLALLLDRVIRYLVYLAIPIATGTIILSDRILQFIYGSQFNNSVITLRILIVAEALVFITFILAMTLKSIGREKQVTYTLLSLSIFNILFNFILIPKYSYVGASVATVASELLSLFILNKIMKKYLAEVSYKIIKPLVASLAMGLIIYYLDFLAIWWLVIVGMMFYSLMLYLLKLPEEDKILVKEIVYKIRVLR